MAFLGVIRNFAALVILTVGALGLSPQAGAARSTTCLGIGSSCTHSGYNTQCCTSYCGPHHNCCIGWTHNVACTKNSDCCSYMCAGPGNRCL